MNGLMKKGTNWDPFRELEEFQNRLESFFGRSERRSDRERLMDWSPVVDILEDEKEYLIKAELPEVKKGDIHVTFENGVLTIQGERKFESQESGKKYCRSERAYGTFVRSFSLPEFADAQKIKAEFKDGVLNVHVPKSERAQPKAVEVNVA